MRAYKITVKKVLIFSLIIFAIYIITFPNDDSPPNPTMVALAGISVISFIVCCLILLVRGICGIGKKFLNYKAHKNLNLEKASSKDTSFNYSTNSEDSVDYEQQELDSDNFRNHLTTIWNSDLFTISFKHSNVNKELLLDRVQINSSNELFFTGYCFESKDERTFKIENFKSYIQYAGREYSLHQFFTKVLELDSEYVERLGV
ncbi:hypothetical protein J3U22_09205 [Gilliamella sp. B2865]|uniref:hypothetical protein n=1 Tax=unclassified Gilliamella TaxID=2685620 RepID=UPI00226A49F2|nr:MULTISPECIES: hypothetical protein [unclassified Gilliamella]MCX8671292.1 hypothetical protein [Gilliamella sp. B2785]MCX8679787.1 hypothetical protein [Gilliamella sp. B2865]